MTGLPAPARTITGIGEALSVHPASFVGTGPGNYTSKEKETLFFNRIYIFAAAKRAQRLAFAFSFPSVKFI
jgi:hypothetical protein